VSSAGIGAAIGGAAAIAAVSTLGDFIWATWIAQHLPAYGLIHGTILFLCVGLFLGTLAKKPIPGALAGAVIGGSAAGSFYLLRPIAGRWMMLIAWVGVWVALAALNEWLSFQRVGTRGAAARSAVAAAASGAAFYLISGIWRPFDPQGWDYLVHLGAWMVAYFPGFAALLVARPR